MWYVISAGAALLCVLGVWLYWTFVLSDKGTKDPRNGL